MKREDLEKTYEMKSVHINRFEKWIGKNAKSQEQ